MKLHFKEILKDSLNLFSLLQQLENKVLKPQGVI